MSARALPAPLRPRPAMPFVGRGEELGGLESLLERGARDGRQVALVGGEPGSGKTRLARELAERAVATGGLVLYGTCDPTVRLPYQPLVEALEDLEADALEHAAGPRAAELTRLLPELGRGLPGLPQPAPGDPDAERYQLHAALVALFAGLARRQPVLLILDDLHWADAASLVSLRHLARRLGEAPVVVLALFREGDGELAPALASTLADLHRLDGILRLRLAGLTLVDIEELVRLSTGPSVSPRSELAPELAALTDGNAFLLGEVWRDLAEHAGPAAGAFPVGAASVPYSVREVMGQRLARLAPATSAVLELVALSPRGLELSVLRSAARLDDDVLAGALDEAVGSGILEEIPEVRILHRFRHELLRRTVHEGVSSLRRARLHLRVAEALEEAPGGVGERLVNDLAVHYRAATPIAGPERAVHYGLAAAAVAERSLAFDEAARHLGEALDLGVSEPALEAATRCRLGTALHLAGRVPEALGAFSEAAAQARRSGDHALLARAAIGLETACWRPGLSDPRAAPLLTAALRASAPADRPQRVRLLAHLSRALAYRGEHEPAGARWTESVVLARQLGDPGVLAMALSHAAWTRGSRGLDDILAAMTEARDLAEGLPSEDSTDVIRGMRIPLLLESWAMDEARREVAAHGALAERAGQPFISYVVAYIAAAIAVCDGRLDLAETHALRSAEIARTFQHGPSATHGIQMFSIRREQGRLAEVAAAVRLVAATPPDADGAWGPALAVLLAEIGDLDAAREAIVRVGPDAIDAGSPGSLRLGTLVYLADACALVGDAALSAPVYAALRRFEGQNLVIGAAVACYGAADRQLGALAAVMGEWELAERHLEAALALNERLESPTWLAHTRYEHGRLLLARGRPADRLPAMAMLADSLAVSERLGLRALAGRIRRLPVAAAPPTSSPDDLSPREIEVLGLVATGLSNREVAGTLHVSEHTVANHLRSILRKTDCANRTQAAAYAHKRGLAHV